MPLFYVALTCMWCVPLPVVTKVPKMCFLQADVFVKILFEFTFALIIVVIITLGPA